MGEVVKDTNLYWKRLKNFIELYRKEDDKNKIFTQFYPEYAIMWCPLMKMPRKMLYLKPSLKKLELIEQKPLPRPSWVMNFLNEK